MTAPLSRRARRHLPTLVLAGLPLAQPALANGETAHTRSRALDTITVTDSALVDGDALPAPHANGKIAPGGRLGIWGEQSAQDVPFSVLSYTAEGISDQQAHTVGDVLRQDPSVQTGYSYGNYGQSYKIRGFDLYPDDIAFSGLYGVMPRQIIDTSAIERVELFKGSSAFMNGVPNGGTGVGGSVNLEPKLAGDTPLTRVGFDYTGQSQAGTSLDVGRRFGADHAYGVRFNGVRRGGTTAVDNDERSTTAGTLAFDYAGERARGALIVGYQRQHIEGGRAGLNTSRLTGSDAFLPSAPTATRNYTPDWTQSTLESSYGVARGEYDLATDWTLFGAFGASYNDEQGVYSSPSLTDSSGSVSYSRMDTVLKTRNFAGNAGLRGHFSTPGLSHALTLAYSANTSQKRSAYTMGSGSVTGSLYDGDVTYIPAGSMTTAGGNMHHPSVVERDTSQGVSLSDTASMFDDRLKLTLGMRYQNVRVVNNDYQGNESTVSDRSAATPVYGVVYQPWKPIALFANHIEALQAGPTAGASYANSGETLGVVRSRQNEVGIKLDTARFGGSLSVFDIRQPSARADASNRLALDGEQQNRGIELALYGTPAPAVRLNGGVTFMDAQLKNTAGGTQDGNRPMGVARYQMRAGAEWDLPWVDNLTLSGTVLRTGPQYADTANQLRVEPWHRLDLGMRYSTRLGGHQTVWRLGVDNVTQERYWESVSTFGYLTQGSPRTVKLSATMDL